MSKILICTAHLDDFELGMGGTTAKLCDSNDVYLLVLCKGDRPGNESVATTRKKTCSDNSRDIGIRNVYFYNYSDTKLDQIAQTDICNIIYQHITKIRPSIVYTHYSDDVHMDHRIVSDATRVSCRMRTSSPVDMLYEFTVPGSTEWGHKPKCFNTYHNITEHINDKMEMISRYQTELRSAPDPISTDMILARDRYHGSICGCTYAEVFNMTFRRFK